MKKTSYDQTYFDKFLTRFNNRNTIITALCERGVGYERKKFLVDEAAASVEKITVNPKRLARSGVAVAPELQNQISDFDYVVSSVTDQSRKLDHTVSTNHVKTTFWTNILGVKGLGQLLDNKRLFVSTSPEEASKEFYVAPKFPWQPTNDERIRLLLNAMEELHPTLPGQAPWEPASAGERNAIEKAAVDKERKVREDEAYLAARAELAQRHAANMFKTIAGTDPIRPVVCVIVGGRSENNLTFTIEEYQVDEAFNGNEHGISHGRLPKAALNTPTDVEIYEFHHDQDRRDELSQSIPGNPTLSSQAFDILYSIYEKTLGRTHEGQPDPHPVVFYSKNGLDRGPKFAFAFYLLSKFDEIFLTATKRPDLDKLVLEAFETFRRSHSPEALSKVHDVVQSFYIAWGLKAVEMQRDCIKKLKEYLQKNSTVDAFRTRYVLIGEMLANLEDPSRRFDVRFANFQKAMAGNHELLSRRHQYALLPGEPEYYTLLKKITAVTNVRMLVESKILDVCEGQVPDFSAGVGLEEDSDLAARARAGAYPSGYGAPAAAAPNPYGAAPAHRGEREEEEEEDGLKPAAGNGR